MKKPKSAAASKAVEKKPPRNPSTLEIFSVSEEEAPAALAQTLTGPYLASALVGCGVGKKLLGSDPDLTAMRAALKVAGDRINAGDLSKVEAMLYSQATALNLLFAEMNRRALNALYDGASFEPGKGYMGISLKAQNQCRMTLETLGNIKNPPAVFARQANIANGPQQINNNAAPHAPARENQNPPSKLLEQSIEQQLDTGTQGQTVSGNPGVATMDPVNRAQVS